VAKNEHDEQHEPGEQGGGQTGSERTGSGRTGSGRTGGEPGEASRQGGQGGRRGKLDEQGGGEGPAGPGQQHEYRMPELAEAAGITVRTLRFYRERKLIPPPRREGRIAWYNDRHLARLRTIAALLDRGHTLGGISELLAAFESGRRDVGELLGLETAFNAPWSEEVPVRLTPAQLADYFPGDVTPQNLAASLDIGYLAADGDRFVHVSRRLLDASRTLVDQGVPLSAVLAAGREVRRQVDSLAATFTALVRTHVLADLLDRTTSGYQPTPEEVARISETVEQLRPLAKGVVEAELSMAMDRRVATELETWPGDRVGTPPGTAEPDATGKPAPPNQSVRPVPPVPPEKAGGPGGAGQRTGPGLPEPGSARH
jgi:DNA-binding transcriptional MerR regulator